MGYLILKFVSFVNYWINICSKPNFFQETTFHLFIIVYLHSYIKYSNLIQIICTQLYGFKYSDLIQIIYTLLYGFKYSYLIQIIYTVVWFQVFLSNTNNLHTDVWFQVFLSNTNNLHTVIWFQVFLSNICTPLYGFIGLVGRVFANGPGDLGSIPCCVIPKTLKIVLDTSLLNTQ